MALLRIFLALLFAILLVFQTLSLPGKFAQMARDTPDFAYLRWPMTFVAAFWLLCVEVVIVSIWRLLTLVKRDRIFSETAFAWVNAIVWAIAAAWVVLLGVFGYVGLNAAEERGPVLLLLLLPLTGLTVLGLLMIVMRALLRQATTLRTDMEAVI